ncbi:MAG: hypothetical protein FD180_5121 [Planctomycetota bacterium]|nr:MAG: hypothetical protein FD180_5121 [Planctomycetota bacterium]
MKRILPLLLLGAVLSVVIFVILKARFGRKDQDGEAAESTESAASKSKTGPRDFQKSKAGLVKTTDIEKGAMLDPNAPETPLGDYVTVREKVLAKWRATKIDVEWDGLPLPLALADLAQRYGLETKLDPAAESVSETVLVEQLEALAALELITRSGNLSWVVTASGELWIMPLDKLMSYAPPAWFDLKDLWKAREAVLTDRNAGVVREPELAKKLRDMAIAARGIPAGDIPALLNFLSQVTDVNYVMRPAERPPALPALAPMEGESLDTFLRRALEPVSYTFTVTKESVIVLSKEQEEAEKKEVASREDERKGRIEAEKEFWKKQVNVGGENVSLRDLSEELSRALNVPLVIDPRSARRSARYTFKAIERPAQEIVDIMKKGAPVEITFREGRIWVLAPEDLHE